MWAKLINADFDTDTDGEKRRIGQGRMKPIFLHRPVNGPFQDPAVFVRILREKRALLFDAGDVSALAARDLMKLTDVFVTHTHIDHFIGFDTIVRALLRRDTPVTFYGPEGIIDRVEGKLRGYTWNLIAEYPLVIDVKEIAEEQIREATFRAQETFVRVDQGTQPCDECIIVDNSLFSVRAVVLEHDVPSLGFSIKEKIHINIDKARLVECGFETGPWLSSLKNAIRQGDFLRRIDTGKGLYRVSELEGIYLITEGQKVSYIMDSSPTNKNVECIVEFVRNADSLYIEAYFLHEDVEHARTRNHLTARLSGMIAKKAGARNLHLLHFSPRYRERVEDIVKEGNDAFSGS